MLKIDWPLLRQSLLLSMRSFTDSAVALIRQARKLQRARNDHAVTPQHIFCGLSGVPRSASYRALSNLGIDLSRQSEQLLSLIPTHIAPSSGAFFSTDAFQLIAAAKATARQRADRHIGTEHLVLAMIMEPTCQVGQFLRSNDILAERFLDACESLRAEASWR